MKNNHSVDHSLISFEILFEESPEAILIVEKRHLIQSNPTLVALFGYGSKEELSSTPIFDFFPRRQEDGTLTLQKLQKMRTWAELRGRMQFECQLQKRDGEIFWADVVFSHIVSDNKSILYVLMRDITGRKRVDKMLHEQKDVLYRLAHYDTLTGLANRTLLMNTLEKQIRKCSTGDSRFALMFVDLDHFKQINDSLGHAAGDSVIQATAERLKGCLGEDDMVARLGGDEFLVLTLQQERETITEKAKDILLALSRPIVQNHYTFYTSASIGISLYPTDTLRADKLLAYADTAMYKAKEGGGNGYSFYTSAMTDMAYDNLNMERDLHEGVQRGEFEVYFQPQVNLLSGKLIGMEALVRWIHPTMGLVTPDKFIGLAEKTGLIIDLDLWVLKSAMSRVAQWHKDGYNPGKLSVNMSIKVIEYPELLEKLEMYMSLEGFKGVWLEIELTETVLMTNPKQCVYTLNRLHDLGITIAIDDFGTGYSSLSYLKHLPIDKLKIDKSFIDDITTDEDAATIVKTIVALAKNLHLDVIAEGVETQEQRDFLLSLGCLKAQGYYYSKTLSMQEMQKYLIARA